MEEESYINENGDEIFNQDYYEDFEDDIKKRNLGGFDSGK